MLYSFLFFCWSLREVLPFRNVREVNTYYKPVTRRYAAIFSKKLLTFSRKSDIIFIGLIFAVDCKNRFSLFLCPRLLRRGLFLI